jgi:hypothetical protein
VRVSEIIICSFCRKRATCAGSYEANDGPVLFGCDHCCGHGQEDGWCIDLTADHVVSILVSKMNDMIETAKERT